jgi:hypothetical protein
MSEQVVASLEGMRVVVNDGWCELHEYNFVANCWVPKARRQWPMERDEAENGWKDGMPSTGSPRLIALSRQQHTETAEPRASCGCPSHDRTNARLSVVGRSRERNSSEGERKPSGGIGDQRSS